MEDKMNKKEKSKDEFFVDEVIKAIDKWAKKHKYNVIFHGGFCAFDKNNNVIDDRLIAYGEKEVLEISMDEMRKEIDKSDESFINW
jgi:hypothetical protein